MVGQKSPLLSTHSDDDSDDDDRDEAFEMTHISDAPPLLPELDRGKGLEIPSRFPSKASSKAQPPPLVDEDFPIPRKSSKRASQQGLQAPNAPGPASFVSSSPGTSDRGHHDDNSGPSHSRHGSTEPPLISLNDDSLMGNLDAHTRHDRPTSMGVVRNHSIRVTDQGSDVDEVRSSAAEIVSLSSQRSRETGRSRET